MFTKKSMGERIFEVFNYTFLLIICILTLYPFIYVLFASFSEPSRIFVHTGFLLKPLGFTLKSYERVFSYPLILTSYRNTLIYFFLGTTVNLILTTTGAYILSRKNFYIRNVMMFIITFTMFFNGGLIPLFFIVLDIGIFNSIWAVILPTAINTMNLIIMRTSFMSIPQSMEESARMDGANDFTILFRIIVPVSLPVISVMILFYGSYQWNSWFHASIFLRNKKLYPMTLVLRQILISNDIDGMLVDSSQADAIYFTESIKYSAIIVAVLPILFVYPFLQKYFVKGVMIGSIKE